MRRTIPLDIGTLHFVGIGGIGMSGMAEVLHNLGYQVQGSDVADSANVKRLRTLGVPVDIGHSADNLGDARVVVVSSAIKSDNPEVQAARKAHLPVVPRADMLAELTRLKWCIAVAGTHGKTTTTSMVAALLDAADFDPTVINGGIINAYDTNARLGEGDWMVVEADESDGTFVKLGLTIAVVTNIDPEHLDFYGGFDAERAAFHEFVEHVPFYGFAVLCIDHAEVQSLIGRVADRRILTYGFNPQAEVRGENIRYGKGGMTFDVVLEPRDRERMLWRDLFLPMPGEHNVQNALAAITVASELGIAQEQIRRGLENFTGVRRRFSRVGEVAGMTIIDDYAHHPVEIAAVLQAARRAFDGRIVAVVQPHRYSRLRDLFEEFCACFNDADRVVVAPVYPAGEAPIEGIDRDSLADGLRHRGHRDVVVIEGPDDLADLLGRSGRRGDVIMCLGAGSITAWAADLAAEIDKRLPKRAGK